MSQNPGACRSCGAPLGAPAAPGQALTCGYCGAVQNGAPPAGPRPVGMAQPPHPGQHPPQGQFAPHHGQYAPPPPGFYPAHYPPPRKSRGWIVALVVVLVLFCGGGSVLMIGAGMFTALMSDDGPWVSHESKEGKFTALFPREPKVVKEDTRSDTGATAVYHVRSETFNALYEVAYFDHEIGGLASLVFGTKAFGEQLAKDKKAKVISDEPRTHQGIDGRYIVMESDANLPMEALVLPTRKRVFMVMCVRTKSKKTDFARFSSNFKIHDNLLPWKDEDEELVQPDKSTPHEKADKPEKGDRSTTPTPVGGALAIDVGGISVDSPRAPLLRADGVVGHSFELKLKARGGVGPLVWDKPKGWPEEFVVEINGDELLITGKPENKFEGPKEFYVSDSKGSRLRRSVHVVVNPLPNVKVDLPLFCKVGQQVRGKVSIDWSRCNVRWAWDDESAPPGLTMEYNTDKVVMHIGGKPTKAGEYSWVVRIYPPSSDPDVEPVEKIMLGMIVSAD